MPIIHPVGPVLVIGSPDQDSEYRSGLGLHTLQFIVEMVRSEAVEKHEAGTGAVEIFDPRRGTWETVR